MVPKALRRGFPARSVFLVRATVARSHLSTTRGDNELPTLPVSEAIIAKLSAKEVYPLTLADLIRHGRSPISFPSLLKAANFSRSILPARLAQRIQSIRSLPFIVVTNPSVLEIHENYMHTLSTLLPFLDREIKTPEDEQAFSDVMAGLVQRHTNTIPVLARGFLESRKYINPVTVGRFLDQHLSARIGTRLVAEQFLALHYCYEDQQEQERATASSSSSSSSSSSPRDEAASSYIGIVDTTLQPASIIRNSESFVAEICELRYGVRPHIVIDGDTDARIAHVPAHLEYILTELLKNAFRAVIEKGNEREPIQVTIATSTVAHSEQSIRNDTKTTKPTSTTQPALTIRIRDRGGGISPANYSNLWTYGFTTFSSSAPTSATPSATPANTTTTTSSSSSSSYGPAANYSSSGMDVLSGGGAGGPSLAGLGYGLPLGRAYAEFFGGGIRVQSLWGWGTDVFLVLRGVGVEQQQKEEEEV